jgi:SpoVK/Ycf46/Vps4 family AAA+-type ATPase
MCAFLLQESHLPAGLSGADLSSLTSRAAQLAIGRCIQDIEANVVTVESVVPRISIDDFRHAANDIRPSIRVGI